jgi:hypothetical protein
MADEKKTIEDLKAELRELQASEDVTGEERLEKTKELISQIKELEAEAAAQEAADAALAETKGGDDDDAAEETDGESDGAGADEATGGDPNEAEAESDDAKESVESPAAVDNDDAGTEGAGDEDGEAVNSEDKEAKALAATQSVDKPKDTPTGPRQNIKAALNTDGFAAGSVMKAEDFGRAQRLAKSRQTGTQIIAAISRGLTGNAVSGRNSSDDNAAILANASYQNLESLTAACFCDPADAVKEIQTCGLDARPVLESFRTVPVIGRFKYTKDLGLADVDGASVIWECADQELVDIDDPLTHKPCVDLDCGVEIEVEPYALPVCGTYDIFQELSHPQRVQAFLDKLAVLHARVAERALLDQIRAQSRIFTHGSDQGLYNNLVFILGQLPSPLQFGERLGAFEGYNLYVPVGTIEALTTDLLLNGTRAFTTAAQAEAYVRDTISSLGVSRIIEILDVDTDNETNNYAPPSAALPAINTPTAWVQGTNNVATHKFYLLRPEDWRAGASEIVEAGTIRDANLVKSNKVQWFMEGLEFIEKTGCGESVVLEITACPSGVATGNDTGQCPPEVIE